MLAHTNFLAFFKDWVTKNAREGNRHAQGCLTIFTEFAKNEFRDLMIKNRDAELNLPGSRITEEVCLRFRQYLTDDIRVRTKTGEVQTKPRLTGDTPMNYYSRFRKMMDSATKEGYFQKDPAEDITARKGRENKLKEILNPDEFDILVETICPNPYISQAFLFCMLTGIRGESVRALEWGDIYEAEKYMSVIQGKTGNKVEIPLLPQAMAFLPPSST